tara:strand:+ start:126 stop:614 length:489 start_codon:yes stop_codon:yes gene_type:complete
MTIKMIIATDCNFGIGKDNKLPWNCVEDLQYFKEKTYGSVVVMGGNTFKSLGCKSLKGRENYVLYESNHYVRHHWPDVEFFNATRFLSYLPNIAADIWVIGGAKTYALLLPYVEEIHHTIIDGVYDCDTFFNMEFLEDWALVGGKDLAENAVVNVWRKNDLT